MELSLLGADVLTSESSCYHYDNKLCS